MPAYVILAHDDPVLLGRLVRRLTGSPIHVHLDAATNLASFESVARLSTVPGAQYVTRRTRVNWGGFSVVDAMLRATTQALPDVSKADHLVYLSGRCYPVRAVSEFEKYLAISGWRVHARAYSLTRSPSAWDRRRYEYRHSFDGVASRIGPLSSLRRRLLRKVIVRLNRMRSPRQTTMDIVAGSQWMALPRACAEDASEAIRTELFSLFRDAWAPDEMAIQTFIYNSKWREETEFGEVEVNPIGIVSALSNFHQLDRNMKGTVELSRVLRPTAREFFVRKMDSRHHLAMLDMLDANSSVR